MAWWEGADQNYNAQTGTTDQASIQAQIDSALAANNKNLKSQYDQQFGAKPADIKFNSALVGGPTDFTNAPGQVSTGGWGVGGSNMGAPLGQLADAYQVKIPNKIDPTKTSLEQMRLLAGNGPDGFLAKQLASNKMATSNLMDSSARTNKNSYYSTLSNMAQNGGVSGAARERALMNSNRNAFANNMDIRRQGALKGLDIQGQGLQKQFDMNNTVQNQDNQLYNANAQQQQMDLQAQQFNIGNTLKEIGSQRAFDLQKYNSDMSAWGANKQADAQAGAARSSGGGGLLGGLFSGLFG